MSSGCSATAIPEQASRIRLSTCGHTFGPIAHRAPACVPGDVVTGTTITGCRDERLRVMPHWPTRRCVRLLCPRGRKALRVRWQWITARPGTYVFGPRKIPYGFKVGEYTFHHTRTIPGPRGWK